jgi:hypothetical protein
MVHVGYGMPGEPNLLPGYMSLGLLVLMERTVALLLVMLSRVTKSFAVHSMLVDLSLSLAVLTLLLEYTRFGVLIRPILMIQSSQIMRWMFWLDMRMMLIMFSSVVVLRGLNFL